MKFSLERLLRLWMVPLLLIMGVGPPALGQDPLPGNLDRIQIVKGWLDNQGDRPESFFSPDKADLDHPLNPNNFFEINQAGRNTR